MLKETGSCDNRGSCLGGVFIVRYNYSLVYDCCDYNLCNSPDYAAKKLNYKCEFSKQVPKTKKLKFPVQKRKTSGVRQCYFCKFCTTYENAKIVNCFGRNATIQNFACSVI